MSVSTCKGCGQQIIWVKSTKGKNIPCDPGIITFTSSVPGETMIVHKDGRVGPLSQLGEGRISHFPTCSQAASFRKAAVKK